MSWRRIAVNLFIILFCISALNASSRQPRHFYGLNKFSCTLEPEVVSGRPVAPRNGQNGYSLKIEGQHDTFIPGKTYTGEMLLESTLRYFSSPKFIK